MNDYLQPDFPNHLAWAMRRPMAATKPGSEPLEKGQDFSLKAIPTRRPQGYLSRTFLPFCSERVTDAAGGRQAHPKA